MDGWEDPDVTQAGATRRTGKIKRKLQNKTEQQLLQSVRAAHARVLWARSISIDFHRFSLVRSYTDKYTLIAEFYQARFGPLPQDALLPRLYDGE